MENNRKACEVIKDNLLRTHLTEEADVMNMTALSAVKTLSGKERFSVVFMDPPYGKDLEKQILREPSFISILEDNALVIVEESLDTAFAEDDYPGLKLLKEKLYKTNKHVFFEKC